MSPDAKPSEQTKGHRAESRTSTAAKAFRISAESSPIGMRACSTISYHSGFAEMITSGFVNLPGGAPAFLTPFGGFAIFALSRSVLRMEMKRGHSVMFDSAEKLIS